VCSDGHGCNY